MSINPQQEDSASDTLSPLPIGCAVCYIVTRLVQGAPWIAMGKVRAYNPATASTFLITRGKPVYTIEVTSGDFGGVQLVSAQDVALHTPENYRAMHVRVSAMRKSLS